MSEVRQTQVVVRGRCHWDLTSEGDALQRIGWSEVDRRLGPRLGALKLGREQERGCEKEAESQRELQLGMTVGRRMKEEPSSEAGSREEKMEKVVAEEKEEEEEESQQQQQQQQ